MLLNNTFVAFPRDTSLCDEIILFRITSYNVCYTKLLREEEEASKKIVALPLKDSGYNPVPSLEKYKRSGSYLIGRNERLHRVAVEGSLFSDLKRADATADTGGKFLIGRYKDLEFTVFAPAELAEFLLEAQVINTYWHVEADFCLVSEEDVITSYSIHYTKLYELHGVQRRFHRF